jgi:oligoribonuclease (3'-5' exoribonuclease)
MNENETYFAWLDLETGGLNGRLENGHLGMSHYPIFEVALIVTDKHLNQVGEPLRIVIGHSPTVISRTSEWAMDTHTKSGLMEEVRASRLDLEDAEQVIIDHLKELGIEKYDRKNKSGAILAGSSIQFDRSYIMAQMPELNDFLHYRQLDVSAFNLAVRAYRPEVEKLVQKEYKHEALADIWETINEFKVYREAFFSESVLMTRENPSGYKLEDLAETLTEEITLKTQNIVNVETTEAQEVVNNNRQIVGLLMQIQSIQRNSLMIMDTLGKDTGPQGESRFGEATA